MRSTAIIAGLFLYTLIFISNGSTAHAEVPQQIALEDSISIKSGLTVLETAKENQAEQLAQEVPKPQSHSVVSGESLAVIAQQYGVTWQRLYDKNLQIADPNSIKPGDVIVIPQADEQIATRPLPEVASPVQPVTTTTQTTATKARTASTSRPVARGSSGGNSYSPGYCTWYAKSRRPDLPNNLGNADTWVARAAAQGFATGSAPRAGAIGQQGMHVVYVERVNSDGTVTISEMNYNGYGVVSSRTVPASTFSYIY